MSTVAFPDEKAKVLIVGCGVLGGDVLHFLTQSGRNYELYIGARDLQKVSHRVNLARYTALNLGYLPTVEPLSIDLMETERTAELIARLRPDVIFNATTLHSWWVITQLPPNAYRRLDRARAAPRTPMHLVLARRLMKAVRQAGVKSAVVNASYPDVVNAVLAGEGLAPTVGIGNVSNAVPGIRLAAAHLLKCDVSDVDVRFFAQHYVSYRMPSTGSTEGAPYHLTIYHKGREVPADSLDHRAIFALVADRFRRVKGLPGQSVTASSATAVLRALADRATRVVHAPGPLGLVGGYPVRFADRSAEIALPPGLSLEAAIDINRRCQRFDGVERVDADGTVHFTQETIGIMREELGYDCERFSPTECEDRAAELARKFAEYRHRAEADERAAQLARAA
ncbi:MAG: hypothetical protein V7604_2315 [Hyphomicrobiales bacterium]|jgi:hypothetical protein